MNSENKSFWGGVADDYMNALDKMHGTKTPEQAKAEKELAASKKFVGMTSQSVYADNKQEQSAVKAGPKTEPKIAAKDMTIQPKAIAEDQDPSPKSITFTKTSMGSMAKVVRGSLESTFRAEMNSGGGCSAIMFKFNEATIYTSNSGRVYDKVRSKIMNDMCAMNEADFPYCTVVCKPGASDLDVYAKLVDTISKITTPEFAMFTVDECIWYMSIMADESNKSSEAPLIKIKLNRHDYPTHSFAALTAAEISQNIEKTCSKGLLDNILNKSSFASGPLTIDAILGSAMTAFVNSRRSVGNVVFYGEKSEEEVIGIIKGNEIPNNFPIIKWMKVLPTDCDAVAVGTLLGPYDSTLNLAIKNILLDQSNGKYVCNYMVYCNPTGLVRVR